VNICIDMYVCIYRVFRNKQHVSMTIENRTLVSSGEGVEGSFQSAGNILWPGYTGTSLHRIKVELGVLVYMCAYISIF
jgi:hypothetical protein